MTLRRYKSWMSCDECGYQGLFIFTCRDDETYDDPDALGVMMDIRCPSCDQEDAVLVAVDQFREMVFLCGEN